MDIYRLLWFLTQFLILIKFKINNHVLFLQESYVGFKKEKQKETSEGESSL